MNNKLIDNLIDNLIDFKNISILNSIPFILWIQDLEGKIIFGNENFYNFFGLNSNIIKSQNILSECLPTELLDRINNKEPGELTTTLECKFSGKNSDEYWLEVHIGDILDNDKNSVGTIFIAHDITTKKETEIYQNRIRKQLKALIKILTNPMENISTEDLISMSIQTIFDYFSDFRISYLLVEDNQITLKYSVEPSHFSSILSTSSEIEELYSYLSLLQIQGYICFDNIKKIKDNQISPVFVDYKVSSLVDIPINFGHNVVAILRIDTESSHHWLEDEVQSFAEIGKNISIILQKNIYRQQMLEYEANLIENYRKLEQYAAELKELKELYENRSEELFVNRELLEEQAFSINMLNQQLIDKEEEIIKTNKQLESALNERDKFFSIIAHDLRGPLSSFLGMTKIINEQSEQFTKEELVEISGLIHNNAETLYSLIENLLNWSRLQRDVIKVEPQIINIKVSIDVALMLFKEALSKKNIELVEKVQSNHFVYADLNMIESVYRNLISNAIKFTPKNGKIYIESYEVDNNYIGISITDTGIGMSEELVSKLFKIDEKVNRPGTEGEPSTGLGLILCKELVEKNDGMINVVSSEGIGSKFEVVLPKKSILEDIID